MSLIKETNLEQLKKAAEEHSGECRKLKENLEISTRSFGQDKKYIREASSIQYRMNYWSETDMVAKIPGEKTCLMSCPEHYNCVMLRIVSFFGSQPFTDSVYRGHSSQLPAPGFITNWREMPFSLE